MVFIGTDIVTIKKIKKNIDRKNNIFLNKIFTINEQKYCDSKNKSYIHYGGKFAAKESVKKAILSSNKINRISLNSIEVFNDENGAPLINLIDVDILYNEIKLSISHTDDYAIAMALITF